MARDRAGARGAGDDLAEAGHPEASEAGGDDQGAAAGVPAAVKGVGQAEVPRAKPTASAWAT